MHRANQSICYCFVMTEITCKGLMFDLDGVLIDSTPAVARVWRGWAVEHGFDPEEVVHKAHGRPSIATLRDYLPHADHEAENKILERREIEDLGGVVELPGARELLTSISPDHWMIVTSCTRPLAEVRIAHAGLPRPKFLLTSSEVMHGKPHPEPYLKGAAMLGVRPEDCVVFEDVPAGIKSGKAAGARVIAFRTTTADGALRNAGADWILQNCSEVSASYNGKALRLGLKQARSK